MKKLTTILAGATLALSLTTPAQADNSKKSIPVVEQIKTTCEEQGNCLFPTLYKSRDESKVFEMRLPTYRPQGIFANESNPLAVPPGFYDRPKSE